MNQVALVGNITDDPELRYTQSGAALAGFTVAVSHRSKHSGEWQDINDGFFRCTAWRSVAENAAKSLHKGDRVLVVGKLIQRNFEVEGEKRSTIEVEVQHVRPDLQFATALSRRRPRRRRVPRTNPPLKEPGFAGLFALGFRFLPSRSQPTAGRTDRRRM